MSLGISDSFKDGCQVDSEEGLSQDSTSSSAPAPASASTSPEKGVKSKTVFQWPSKFSWAMYLSGLIFFAYFAAAALGFFGIFAPFKAAVDPNIGSSVILFVVGIIPVVFIMVHYGANLITLKNCIIVALVPVALLVIVYAWFPLVFSKAHLKAEEKNLKSVLVKQSTGSMLHIADESELKVYTPNELDSDDGTTSMFSVIERPKSERKDVSYPVKDIKDIRRDGHYLLISVYLPQNVKHPEKFPIGWVRLGKEFGTKIMAKENLVPKKEVKAKDFKRVDYVFYIPGQVKVFKLKAGEKSDHYIRAQGVSNIKLQSRYGDYEIITRSGKIYDPKNIPKYFPEDFIVSGVTDTEMRIKFL